MKYSATKIFMNVATNKTNAAILENYTYRSLWLSLFYLFFVTFSKLPDGELLFQDVLDIYLCTVHVVKQLDNLRP